MFSLQHWHQLSELEKTQLLQRPPALIDGLLKSEASHILYEVQHHQDAALERFSKRFDKVDIRQGYKVDLPTCEQARGFFSKDFLHAYEAAAHNIEVFHQAQRRSSYTLSMAHGEITCERHYVPLEAVGLYVPAGNAPLFSSLMMMAIPARIAGCTRIVVCSAPYQQPSSDPGTADTPSSSAVTTPVTVHPYILHLAPLLGVHEVYALGGAQAIAAMAFGTASLPKVSKIFGPGNVWVSEAKRQICHREDVACTTDLHAGPSEVMVITDHSARPQLVATDLLAQAEHGPDSQVLCILCHPDAHHLFEAIVHSMQQQMQTLSRRSIIEKALKHARFIAATHITEALQICHLYAPEHLILALDQPRSVLQHISHAGSIFLGHHTPESLGDYASGTNHVLPTGGTAALFGGLGVEAFQRSFTVQELHPEKAQHLPRHTIELAQAEGLDAHAQAMKVRLTDFPSITATTPRSH